MMLARSIVGSNEGASLVPRVMAGLPGRFPLPGLRLWALRGAYAWYRMQDER